MKPLLKNGPAPGDPASEERLRLIMKSYNGIAHEFNNVLAAIIGYAELARLSVPADSPAFEALNESLKASRRATDLVRKILASSSPEEYERELVTTDYQSGGHQISGPDCEAVD
jgi:light-regulated signal transduction histidine kinase (bacteriophytochrome)